MEDRQPEKGQMKRTIFVGFTMVVQGAMLKKTAGRPCRFRHICTMCKAAGYPIGPRQASSRLLPTDGQRQLILETYNSKNVTNLISDQNHLICADPSDLFDLNILTNEVFCNVSNEYCYDNLPCTYPYTHQLITLRSFIPVTPNPLPDYCKTIATPLRWTAWQQALLDHPDKVYADYVLG